MILSKSTVLACFQLNSKYEYETFRQKLKILSDRKAVESTTARYQIGSRAKNHIKLGKRTDATGLKFRNQNTATFRRYI